MPIIFLPNKRHITSRYLGGLSAYIKYSRKCVCGLFNCAFAGRFICFPWRNCFSVYLAKQKINHAFDTSLNIRELAPEETTFQEYSKVTSFQTVAVNSYFLLKVPVGPRPNIFCDRNHRTLFPLYNQLPKDLWLALKNTRTTILFWETTSSPAETCQQVDISYSLTNQLFFGIIFELHTRHKVNAKTISLANSSCTRGIWSVSCFFFTWALTDGV